jgi:hypothetical protein
MICHNNSFSFKDLLSVVVVGCVVEDYLRITKYNIKLSFVSGLQVMWYKLELLASITSTDE